MENIFQLFEVSELLLPKATVTFSLNKIKIPATGQKYKEYLRSDLSFYEIISKIWKTVM